MKIAKQCDLSPQFGPARDQSPRPTCMAFAASDAHAAIRAGWSLLSAEWAYYHALQRDGGKPDDGVTMSAMLESLQEDGQPLETGWPYISADISNITAWVPPTNVGSLFRRASEIINPTVQKIMDYLDSRVPVLMTMMLSSAFYTPQADGIIASAEPPDPQLRHAVVCVGHGRRGSEVLVLIRNSWGPGWGIAGYAWLATTYLQPRVLRAAVLTTEI